jgi:hypothetical protein
MNPYNAVVSPKKVLKPNNSRKFFDLANKQRPKIGWKVEIKFVYLENWTDQNEDLVSNSVSDPIYTSILDWNHFVAVIVIELSCILALVSSRLLFMCNK